MPVLGAPLDPVTVASLKGTLDYYLWRGIPVVRSWPRRPKMPRTAAVTASYQEFGQVAHYLSQIPIELRTQAEAQTVNTNWTWRDLWTAALYGNLYHPLKLELPSEPLNMPPLIPGRYYSMPATDAAPGTTSLATGTIRCVLFYVAELATFDQIAWEVTATTGGNDRVALYGPLSSDPSQTPLLIDSGNIAISSTGVKTFTIGQTLAPGWYLLGLQGSSTRTYRTIALGSFTAALGQGSAGSSRAAHGINITQAFGAFPNPLGTPSTYDNSANAPLIALRAA